MKTAKETFSGSESLKNPNRMGRGRGEGMEQMVRDEVAQQVADALRSI